MEELEQFRLELDVIDNGIEDHLGSIMGLLISRLTVVDQVAEFKKRNNMDALQPARFNQMLERLHKRGAEIGVPKELIDEVWSAIHRQSLERENGRLSKDD